MANHKWVYFNNILQNLIYKTCRECCHPVEAQRNVHQPEAEEFSIPQVINKSKWQTYKTDSTKSIPKSCILVSRVGGGLGHREGEWRSGDTQIELIETSCLSEEMKPLNSMGKKNGHHSGGSASFKKASLERRMVSFHWALTWRYRPHLNYHTVKRLISPFLNTLTNDRTWALWLCEGENKIDFSWLPGSILQRRCPLLPLREGRARTTAWELRPHVMWAHTISGSGWHRLLLLLSRIDQWPFQASNLCWCFHCNNSLHEFFS